MRAESHTCGGHAVRGEDGHLHVDPEAGAASEGEVEGSSVTALPTARRLWAGGGGPQGTSGHSLSSPKSSSLCLSLIPTGGTGHTGVGAGGAGVLGVGGQWAAV